MIPLLKSILANGCDKPWYAFCLLILLFSYRYPSLAQPDPAVFTRIDGTSFGILEMDVYDLWQDRDGFMWIATTKGLIRYDGQEMRVFREDPNNPQSLQDNRVRFLEEDHTGTLWVGTSNYGVARYDRFTERFQSFQHDADDPASISSDEIDGLAIDKNGDLWVATKVGLDRFDQATGNFEHFGELLETEGVFNIEIEGLVADLEGRIWMTTIGKGLHMLDPAKSSLQSWLTPNRPMPGINSQTAKRVTVDPQGNIWFSSGDVQVHKIDPHTLDFTSYPVPFEGDEDITAQQIISIVPTDDGNLWLGTRMRGLIHFAPALQQFTTYRHDPSSRISLTSDAVTALCLDRQNQLWIGHIGPELSKLSITESGFEIIPIAADSLLDLNYPGYRAVLEDSQRAIWMSTWGNGLLKYDPATQKSSLFKKGRDLTQHLGHNIVWDLLEDSQDRVWIATHGGLQRTTAGGEHAFVYYGPEQGLTSLKVRSLLEDQEGNLWIGTFAGLFVLRAKTQRIEAVPILNEDHDYAVVDLLQDRQGYIWISIINHGVLRLKPSTMEWQQHKKEQRDLSSLTSNLVWSMAEDRKGRIWMGTSVGGLCLYLPNEAEPDSARFRHWRMYNSDLGDDNIYNVSVDAQDNLWLSTDAGLYLFNTRTEKFKYYSLAGYIKGLNVETRPGKDGELYVGNAQYIYKFHPERLWKNPYKPPVFLTHLQINGREVPIRGSIGDTLSTVSPITKSVSYASAIKLAHWQNNLSFSFAALNFIRPEDNRFRVKLEGNDEEWLERKASQAYVMYTNLPPNDYRLIVQASINQGVWNSAGTSLLLRIAPPWWATIWARMIWLGLLGTGIYALYRQQLNRRLAQAENQQLQDMDLMKTRLYTNITHEFRTPLTIILGLAAHLRSQVSEHAKESLQLIRRNGEHLLKLVNQMLDLSKLESGFLKLNLQQDDIVNYLKYLIESHHSVADSKQIRLHFICDLKTYYLDYDPYRLMHIMTNLLTNAIKFTPAGKDVYISAQVLEEQHVFEIKVRDTGIGIPSEKLPYIFDRFYQAEDSITSKSEGTGIGLTLTKELVKLMGGEIEVASELGIGSIFTVFLPISQQQAIMRFEPNPASLTISEPSPVALDYENQKDTAHPLLLIVEDNQDLVRYLIQLLNPSYRIEVAYNGQQGIEKAIDLIPDIILTDVMMPVKDGYAFTFALKRHELTSHIPMIMLTARAEVESRIAGLQAGADAYLSKPFESSELLVLIKNLLLQREKLRKHYWQERYKTLHLPLPNTIHAPAEKEDTLVSRARQIILESYQDPLFSVEQLSEKLGVSQPQLYRKLVATTGQSAKYLIRSIRIEAASSLLRKKEMNISEVAYQTGFKDPDYFSKVFKSEVGMSPSTFRRSKE